MKDTFKYYIAIGLLLGTSIGVVTKNVGLWVAIGLVIGVAVGVSRNNEKKE